LASRSESLASGAGGSSAGFTPEWVWVPLTSMCSTGIPVALAASSLASATTFLGTPRLSITTQTNCVLPSSMTKARALSGSWAEVAGLGLKPPGMFIGNSFGVISTAAAPAFKGAAERSATMETTNKQARMGGRIGQGYAQHPASPRHPFNPACIASR